MNFNLTIVNFKKYTEFWKFYQEYWKSIGNVSNKRFDQRDSHGRDSVADMCAIQIISNIACSYVVRVGSIDAIYYDDEPLVILLLKLLSPVAPVLPLPYV